jgi:uncharacterized RDD family membrane protein YckC
MIRCKTQGAGNPVFTMSSDADLTIKPAPRYARFSRRLRGIVLDWIIAMVVMFGAVLVATTVRSDDFARALGILVVVALLLYEPVLVSLTGGTLGHYFTNLRVVDERDGGNVSFLKACARLVIKGLLGWYSFIIIAATRRNQAVHDLVTRSTVQIRDPAKALPGQYITERTELAASGLPSRGRRVAVICGYLLLLTIAFFVVFAGIIAAGLMSDACINNDFCSAGERFLILAAALALLPLSALCIGLGWRGSLMGARKIS